MCRLDAIAGDAGGYALTPEETLDRADERILELVKNQNEY